MFAFLAAHRAEVFPDADYADLFAAAGGWPAVAAGYPDGGGADLAGLARLFGPGDGRGGPVRRAVEGGDRAPLDDPGFDPSSLVYWRNRIAKSERPHRISDAVRKVVRETGVLRGRRRRAVDSTILADAVATQDTVTQLVSAIRKVAREVPGAAEQIARVCTGP